MSARDLEAPKFKPGDRVLAPRSGDETVAAVIVGPAPLSPQHLIIQWDTLDPVVGRADPADLTLIPDTVTVTVELPRDDSEAVLRSMEHWHTRSTEPALRRSREVWMAALREALR